MGDTDITITLGKALVYGRFYELDTSVEDTVAVPAPGDINYYRFVLQVDWATQEVRAVKLGPSTVALPALTQTDGVTWEINLADVTVSDAGVVTVTDQRKFLSSNEKCIPRFAFRIGDTAQYGWSDPVTELSSGIIAENPIRCKHTGRAQCGAIEWTGVAAASGNIAVTFPIAYSYKPVVVTTPMETTARILVSVVPTTTGVTIYWQTDDASTRTTIDFQWLALGPILRGA